jgi:cyclase
VLFADGLEMTVLPRVIPSIVVDNGRAINTQQFVPKEYLGDPLVICRIFAELGADEIFILDRSRKHTISNLNRLINYSDCISVPLAYGGGLEKMSDVDRVMSQGADKVVIKVHSGLSLRFLTKVSNKYGAQALVLCLNLNVRNQTTWLFQENIKSLHNQLEKMISLGVGELLIQDVSRVGTFQGLDLNLFSEISKDLSIPVVISGGVKDLDDLKKAFSSGFSGVSISSFFSLYQNGGAPLLRYINKVERHEIYSKISK